MSAPEGAAGSSPGRLRAAVELGRRALAHEVGMWRSLYRWLARRPVLDGSRPFTYARAITPVLWAFIGVSAVEIPLIHVLLPWPAVRQALLVVGVYGLLWMIGLLASLWVHPHTVGEPGLRLRYGPTANMVLGWEDIDSVRFRLRPRDGMRSVQVDEGGPGRALHLVVSGQTNVDVVLRRPLPLLAWRGDHGPVTEVHFFADEARALVAAVRERLAERRPSDVG
jgi:hypothetical protein